MNKQATPTLTGECLAEFIGTGLLIFFGVGCVAALILAGANFGQWEISLTWGFGVSIAIFVTGGISGAHLNPAVTLALMVWKGFEKRKVLPFILAQLAGAFCAAALVYFLYSNLFTQWESTHHIVRGSQESLDNLDGNRLGSLLQAHYMPYNIQHVVYPDFQQIHVQQCPVYFVFLVNHVNTLVQSE
jgi:glycerol uptake facilitator protein